MSSAVTSAGCEGDICNPEDLIRLFNGLFKATENTVLVRGESEPIYLPADDESCFHRVVFAHGFFSSALHEIAHWCIAGAKRRREVDYGYWYAPDGRNVQQQRAFEQVEVKPQALEWIFSRACDKPFRISVDNLNGVETDPMPFKRAVFQQVQTYCRGGIPPRARRLVEALAAFYQTPDPLRAAQYRPQEIGIA